jgi:hypothetical protein
MFHRIKSTTQSFIFSLGLITLVFFGLPKSIQASTKNIPSSPTQIAIEKVLVQNPWVKTNQNKIELLTLRESEIGFHLTFCQKHQGVNVYGASVKVNLSKNYQVLSFFSSLIPIHVLLPVSNFTAKIAQNERAYLSHNGNWQSVRIAIMPNEMGEMEEHVFDEKGNLLSKKPLDLFLGKDTIVKTKVFNPDPLTTAQKTYGQDNLYKNYNGADAPELTAELKTVDVTLLLKNDTFYAQSPYAQIEDLEAPAQVVFKSKQANFNFTRSSSKFREMNCLYHIEQVRKYLKSIGMPFDSMFVIKVDPTAYQGQDQSRFSYSNSNPALYFGTGGVPDAEDADVVIHEYSHGIFYFIAPNSLGSLQRLAMEEANCDFMACQYSRAISNYNWRWVFNWDGHNEFWPGRDANKPNVYPKDLSTDAYESSSIWSSMLNDIGQDLGREVSTKLLLNSIYSYFPEMNMQNAADLLMQADSILYGYAHANALKLRLEQRGFSVVMSLNEHLKNTLNLAIINSAGFANGSSPVSISKANFGLIQGVVYDIEGRIVLDIPTFSKEISIKPEQLKTGTYFLSIKDEDGNSQVIKLMRLE